MLSIGFTRTRRGMAPRQLDAVRLLIVHLAPPDAMFHAHHGDCTGANKQFHGLCRETNGRAYVVVHPGPIENVARQAACLGDDRHYGRPHMARNRDIVDASTVMIRMARRAGKPLAIVLPSGEVVKERWV